ncbi:MAG: protein-ADP-ribose hydrolase [Clostridiales bacterium]|nr:protein-ADP-ribose hydrolase [Clostridiales bacterium]
MNQEQKLDYLITSLLQEQARYEGMGIPDDLNEKKRLFRSLVNVRAAVSVDAEFLAVQDSYLQQELKESSVAKLSELEEMQPHLFLWQGDITKLEVDGIVNAANNAMLGCFYPCHGCIDNAIHTFAGVQLRLKCHEMMLIQGHEEETGTAKITSAYNLPSRYVLHTVGPIIGHQPTQAQQGELASCYRACFELADQNNLQSLAYCCISTGEFRFPNQLAAEIAIRTVNECLKSAKSIKQVVFNVYKDEDRDIYAKLLR